MNYYFYTTWDLVIYLIAGYTFYKLVKHIANNYCQIRINIVCLINFLALRFLLYTISQNYHIIQTKKFSCSSLVPSSYHPLEHFSKLCTKISRIMVQCTHHTLTITFLNYQNQAHWSQNKMFTLIYSTECTQTLYIYPIPYLEDWLWLFSFN